MALFDTLFPFLIGHRTQLTALLTTILNVLGATGVIPAGILGTINSIAAPLGLGFLAAKVSRQ